MKHLSAYTRFWLVAAILAAIYYTFASQGLVAFLFVVIAGNHILDAWSVGELRAENANLRRELTPNPPSQSGPA